MPVTGKLLADFESFYVAVDKAEAELVSLQRTGGSTEVAMTKMSTASASSLTRFHDSLSTVDKSLNAVGISINREMGAIRELGEASGKTAKELGLIGTAGLAITAAMAGWNLGRRIADWTGLDQAIGDATAKLLGWGDAAGQEAGAAADVLARASKTAGREITDLSEAMRINRAAADAFIAGQKESAGATEELAKAAKAARADLLERFEESFKQGNEDYKKALEEQKKADADYRDYRNMIGEREIEDHARQLEDEKRLEKEWREYQNMLGERQMEADLANMQKLEAEAKALAESMSASALPGEGLVIIGQQAEAAGDKIQETTSHVNRLGESLLKLAVPPGFSFEQAYKEAGFVVHGSLAGGNVHRGPVTNVTIQDGFFDTPTGAQRMADRMGTALESRLRNQGRSLG